MTFAKAADYEDDTEDDDEPEWKPVKIFRAEANFLKVDGLPKSFVQETIDKYTFSFYEEKSCQKCPLFEQRHSEPCDTCESFKGTRQLGKVVKRKDVRYLSVPIGGKKRLNNLLERFKLKPVYVDRFNPNTTLHRPIKVTRELREWQHEALAKCLEQKRGIIEAPPRSGKTVLGVAVTSAVQGKTLIIASQRDWLDQFKDTFIGKEDEEAFTNINPRRIGFCSSIADFEKHDVCLATFQQFMNDNGRAILSNIKTLFKLVIIDECHGTAALETSRVLSKLSAEYLFGLSGTPQRKLTSEEIVFKLLIGPIIYKAKVVMLKPELVLLRTNVEVNLPKGQSDRGAFARFINKLEAHKDRIEVIAKFVARSVKRGHSVMVPVARQKSVKLYVDAINEYFEENICATFTGQLSKDMRIKNLRDIRAGTKKVVVGNISLLSTGLNIPRLSMLIDRVTITSNIPKTIQRVARILTPMEGKQQTKLVLVLDDCDMQRSTSRNEYHNAIKPRFDPIVSPENNALLHEWFKEKSLGSSKIRVAGSKKKQLVVYNSRSL